MSINFVSLHNHTHNSILDGLSSPKDLLKRAKELDMPALAITDHASLLSAHEAFKASKEIGVKLIIGFEGYFVDDANTDKDVRFRHIILLAKNATGYRNLLTINRKAFDHSANFAKKVYPLIDWALLAQYSEGLICLTSCSNGILSQLLMSNRASEAEQQLQQLMGIFGDDLALEVQPNMLRRGSTAYNDVIEQRFVNRQIINLGKKYNVKVVPTCNAHYATQDESATHDVLLAIGSHQPVYSNFRLKYDVPDFYLKSGDEVATFFERNYGREYAEEICANTLYFANKCEEPNWISPKFSNPSGKELPEFPVKEESDYTEFLEWLGLQDKTIKALEEDQQFLKYRCEKAISKLNLPQDKISEYRSRLESELDVLYYCGVSSYMLIVADYLDWCRKNDIAVGPGRGCLTGNTPVLTNNGFKKLDSITISDKVYTHTGQLQEVFNTFKFDVSKEILLKINTQWSFDPIILTKDHKVFAAKAIETNQYKRLKTNGKKSLTSVKRFEKFEYPQWIRASELSVNDAIYTTYPIRQKIENSIPQSYDIIYSSTSNSKLDKKSKLIVDNDFFYMLGRFVGDGWTSVIPQQKYQFGIAFHSNDTNSIKWFKKYFKKLNLNVGLMKHKTKKLVQLQIYNKSLINIISNIFPDYKNTSDTKHLPLFFRQLNDEQLRSLINGIIDSDGHKTEKVSPSTNRISFADRISIDSTSKRLILEIKELLLFLKTKSSIQTRKNFKSGKYSCNESYKLRFTKSDYYNINNKDSGYFSKILEIIPTTENYVYDISVDKDHSYLTSNYIVHNSVGGSYVAYLLNIHEADPIKYDLVFERFFNKKRTSFADIDCDFSKKDRYKVIDYITKKYGKDHVAAISNIITITPKVYVRDLARAYELGGSRDEAVAVGNILADTIAAEFKSIDEAMEKAPLFVEYTKKYPELLRFKSICGKPRAAGQHAAGIIISKRPLHTIVPLRVDKDNIVLTEYDKDVAEENGLVKMDILGLSTLDIIGETNRLIKASGREVPQINYDEYDQATYDLISSGNTFGVFQFGTSAGTIDLCKKIKPKTIEDLAVITTLARPASQEIREDFIKTREGKRPVSLLHPLLKRAFDKTHGFPLYDESLLILAKDVAGWDFDEADKLRKLTKEKGKNPQKVAKWREEFIQGATNNGVRDQIAAMIWDNIIVPFGRYSFNASHAVLYSMLSYYTAYLKAHFPIEFLLANLMQEVGSNAPDTKSNIERIKKEIRDHGIKIIPPNINKSQLTYTIDDNKLITGLDALKYVGDDAIKNIIEQRPFKDFFDFMSRIDSKKVRANTIQALIACGCLDGFKLTRKQLFLYCSDYRKKLQVWLKTHDPITEIFNYPWPSEEEWSLPELYALEYEYLNEAFICGKLKAYDRFFQTNDYINVRDVKRTANKTNIKSVKAVIKDFFEFTVKKEKSKFYGQAMAKVLIEDVKNEQCTLTVFPDRWKMLGDRIKDLYRGKYSSLEEGMALHFSATTNIYEDEIGLIMNDLYNCVLPPQKPTDLRSRKISLKAAKKDKVVKQSLSEEIEDELIQEGIMPDIEESDE